MLDRLFKPKTIEKSTASTEKGSSAYLLEAFKAVPHVEVQTHGQKWVDDRAEFAVSDWMQTKEKALKAGIVLSDESFLHLVQKSGNPKYTNASGEGPYNISSITFGVREAEILIDLLTAGINAGIVSSEQANVYASGIGTVGKYDLTHAVRQELLRHIDSPAFKTDPILVKVLEWKAEMDERPKENHNIYGT